jgi:hypothetical protein
MWEWFFISYCIASVTFLLGFFACNLFTSAKVTDLENEIAYLKKLIADKEEASCGGSVLVEDLTRNH